MLKITLLFAASVAVAAAHQGHDHTHDHDHVHAERTVISGIVKLDGPGINGNITFTQLAEGKVQVTGVIYGLPAGQYGFHIHEKGDLTGGCGSTGGHYNPEGKDHGHPSEENRHVGDLGNIVFTDQKTAEVNFTDHVISLNGPYSIIGRAVVLHEGEDDYGRSSHPDSKKTGNAGGRAACGVIGILDPVYGARKTNAASVSSMFFTTIMTTTALAFVL